MTIPGVRSTLEDDFYVRLVAWEQIGSQSATFKIYHNPLVNFVWFGGLVFILGTLVAAWPGRGSEPAPRRIPAPPIASAGAGRPAGLLRMTKAPSTPPPFPRVHPEHGEGLPLLAGPLPSESLGAGGGVSDLEGVGGNSPPPPPETSSPLSATNLAVGKGAGRRRGGEGGGAKA